MAFLSTGGEAVVKHVYVKPVPRSVSSATNATKQFGEHRYTPITKVLVLSILSLFLLLFRIILVLGVVAHSMECHGTVPRSVPGD